MSNPFYRTQTPGVTDASGRASLTGRQGLVFCSDGVPHRVESGYCGTMAKQPVVEPAVDLSSLSARGFDVMFLSHAKAILMGDFPDALRELEEALLSLTVPIEELIGSGGGETKGTQRLRRALAAKSWGKRKFTINKTINDIPSESISHEMDHVRDFRRNEAGIKKTHCVALEIEWNNKDPFFDRDLENFKRLHAEGAISVGVIVTRGKSLQDGLSGLVRRWVDENSIDSHDDLDRLEVEQTRRQKREVLKRVTRDKSPVPFRDAWTSGFVADKYGQATTHWKKLEDRVARGVGNPCPLLLIGLPVSLVRFGETAEAVKALIEESLQGDDQVTT